jgi:hypothetical protein
MASGPISRLWLLARKTEELFNLHTKVESSLRIIEERLRALEDRVIRLEISQGQLFTEARNAATVMAAGVISEAVTRITRLEGRAEILEQTRHLPPQSRPDQEHTDTT